MSWLADLIKARRGRPQTTAALVDEAGLDPDVRDWLRASYVSDEHVQRQQAADRLRGRGEPAVAVLVGVHGLATRDHALRWAIVRCASEVGGPRSVEFLGNVLGSEVPPEESRDIHHYSTVAEETAQRMQAIRGLADLAAAHPEAVVALLNALDHPLRAVRFTAYRALAGLPRDVVGHSEIDDRLREAHGEFAEVHAVDVRAVNGTDGEVLVSTRSLPSPPTAGDDGSGGYRTSRRAPQLPTKEGRSDG